MASASSSLGSDSRIKAAEQGSALAPPSDRPRQTHIHFPTEVDSVSSKPASPSDFTGAGLHSLEPGSTLSVPGSHDDEFFERRRVRSANASEATRPYGSYSRSQFLPGPSRSRTAAKRVVSLSSHGSDRSYRKGTSSIGSSPLSGDVLLPPALGTPDQGDDPNILADLRKALQYKPRVEQQLKEAKSLTEFPSSLQPSTSNASPMSSSPSSRPAWATFPRSEPNTPVKPEFVDFSPSVGKASLHPVPTSADDGATLDWSGSTDDEKHERKWTMSLSRKSSKDKHPTLSRKALVERQDSQYSDKLTRIRQKANELTIRKAEITKDQLQRRYTALNASFTSAKSRLNLVSVARWFDKQENVLKALIVENEPMPWLRHLLHGRGTNQGQRRLPSPWNVSAMIVDEYMRSASDAEFVLTTEVADDNASEAGSSASAAIMRRPASGRASFRSFDGGSGRKSDELLSFEPLSHSRRDSVGADSRASVDTQLKRWRQSLLHRADNEVSSEGSVRSRRRTGSLEQGNGQTGQNSSANSRSPLHSLGIKRRSNTMQVNSDEGQSSAADSMIDRSKESTLSKDVPKKPGRESRRSRFPLSLDLRSAQPSFIESKQRPGTLSIDELRTDVSTPNKSQSLPVGKEGRATPSVDPFDGRPTPNNQLASPIALDSVRKPDRRKTHRVSLPPAFQTPKTRRSRSNTRTEAQNHALQVEYTRKKELLDALVARNQRMRALLQVASRSIHDYDETQSSMAQKLGLNYQPLPPEVLEAVKHDPSASVGHLRSLQGWRAVEDIHLRRERQKDVLQRFTSSLQNSIAPLSLPKDGIYERTMASLSDLVERLHSQRSTVLSHVRQTHELLARVKKMRDELKPEFDEASKHTSANYPELVQLESLLDEIVNETNKLWRLAEASISFLLTSVAPLMKTFGRPVWDEVHDFLVIPLYRNGFSGEDHWYPVTFPRRSLVHWLRLLFFSTSAPLLLYHGARFFVALLTHGYVIRIPVFIPTFVVYVVFSGLMCAFASLLFGLFVVVLCEMFIVLWWLLWLLRIVR
ncbi:uncharacterized protein FOMMEDRAFT_166988 [Fomitiporia mediterranea MF3/22]|uniref:uncharacterized protein n=1 Tax=Fomitiporia mediterranea (strain MF3/22) TaxID=694068 RepID=UPI00044098E8|nr:uncharacterized protein FOMMEDRAFT_166988 [Fomitiporia mediterranea MF3/22]EJD03634.1 hypothetical protein FOMMEDRAFT_166988 [Fomitiporia mediterranea MF3/22]